MQSFWGIIPKSLTLTPLPTIPVGQEAATALREEMRGDTPLQSLTL